MIKFSHEIPDTVEMDRYWFFYLNENISGPFTPDEIRAKITNTGTPAQCLIWTKGQKQWIPAAIWESNFDQIVNSLPKPAHQVQDWYYNHNDRTQGPVSQTELVKYLRTLQSIEWGTVLIKRTGQEKWSKIFQFTDLLEEIGGSRRFQARVPLSGTVVASKDSQEQIGRCATISIGGMGVTGLSNLNVGDVIKLTIKCEEFGHPVYVAAQVKYVTADEVGLQFQNLHMEFQLRISDYIKKFQASTATLPTKKTA